MIYQVLKATVENPTKNDFVKICIEYMDVFDIKMSFKDVEKMSTSSFKKLVKEKTRNAAFNFLSKEKEKQTKIANIKYDGLEIQEYLASGLYNVKFSRLIFKARSKTLDIKSQRRWQYDDTLCVGCKQKEESGQELLTCEKLNYENSVAKEQINYDDLFSNEINKLVKVAKLIENGLKKRKQILETGIT